MHIIIEGSRGMGKSTVAHELRKRNMQVVLTNHTAISADEPITGDYMTTYYQNYIDYMSTVKGLPFNYVHDRFLQSEYVMSKLYKASYRFTAYNRLMSALDAIGERVLVVYLYNTSDSEIERNLSGDSRKGKADLFNNSRLRDGLITVKEQMLEYLTLYEQDKKRGYENIEVLKYNVSGKSIEGVVNYIQGYIDGTR